MSSGPEMESIDGVEFVNLGICVVIDDGTGVSLGITHDQLAELVNTDTDSRSALVTRWRTETQRTSTPTERTDN